MKKAIEHNNLTSQTGAYDYCADWIEVHGSLGEHARQLLEQDPSYFERVLDFTAHAWRHGPLHPRIKALVLLAAALAVLALLAAALTRLGVASRERPLTT